MIGVGIGYLIMGLVPAVVKKLNGRLHKSTAVVHTGFLYCGIAILVLYGLGFLLSLDAVYRTALAVLPILAAAPMLLVYLNKQLNDATRKEDSAS